VSSTFRVSLLVTTAPQGFHAPLFVLHILGQRDPKRPPEYTYHVNRHGKARFRRTVGMLCLLRAWSRMTRGWQPWAGENSLLRWRARTRAAVPARAGHPLMSVYNPEREAWVISKSSCPSELIQAHEMPSRCRSVGLLDSEQVLRVGGPTTGMERTLRSPHERMFRPLLHSNHASRLHRSCPTPVIQSRCTRATTSACVTASRVRGCAVV
jgi:hypothetical protein